jgi:propane monooxygenase small subunit
MLADDEMYGAENKATMQEWLAKWTPVSVLAARTLQPIWSQPAEKSVRFEESMERSWQRFTHLLSDIGLETPKEA